MIQSILEDPSTVAFGIFLLGQGLGIVLHWTARWLKGEVDCISDMALTEWRWTVGSLLAQMLAAVGVFATGVVDGESPAKALAIGIAGGGAIDAFLNRARRRPWSAERRRRERARKDAGGEGG